MRFKPIVTAAAVLSFSLVPPAHSANMGVPGEIVHSIAEAISL
jgi:hypothetical protein